MVMLHIKLKESRMQQQESKYFVKLNHIKGNHQMQQHGSKYFAADPSPTPDPAVGVKRSTLTF